MKLILYFVMLVSSHSSVFAAGKCEKSFEVNRQTLSERVVVENSDLYGDFRANVAHYWSWAKLRGESCFASPLLESGVVAGDAHPLNFGDLWVGSKKEFTLIDIDDAGRASYLLDIARFMTAAQITKVRLSAFEILSAYEKGLRGDAVPMPESISRTIAASQEKILELEKEEFKKVTKDKKFNKKAKLLEPDEWSIGWAEELGSLKNQLTARGYRIYDQGVRVKMSGGSLGVPRFLFAVEKSGHESVFEFKKIPLPSTQHYQPVPDNKARLDEVISIFWPRQFAPQEILQLGAATYWLRSRTTTEFEKEPNAYSPQEWSYIAFWLGQKHGQQASDQYKNALRSQVGDISESLRTWAQDYVQELQRTEGE